MLGVEYTVSTFILLAVLAGIVSWGTTQTIKTAAKKYRAEKLRPRAHWWWNTWLRITAITVGGCIGLLLMPNTLGAVIAVCAGILNTTMVTFVKNKLKTIAADTSAAYDDDENSDEKSD